MFRQSHRPQADERVGSRAANSSGGGAHHHHPHQVPDPDFLLSVKMKTRVFTQIFCRKSFLWNVQMCTGRTSGSDRTQLSVRSSPVWDIPEVSRDRRPPLPPSEALTWRTGWSAEPRSGFINLGSAASAYKSATNHENLFIYNMSCTELTAFFH